jgi:hypothetical protein
VKPALPIVNPTAPHRIVVTAGDVRRAKPMDETACAFAKACMRLDPDVERVQFKKTRAYLVYPDRIERYVNPAAVQQEIVAFDRGGRFAPGEYELRPLSPSQRRKPTGKVSGKAGGAGKIRFRHITAMVRGNP